VDVIGQVVVDHLPRRPWIRSPVLQKRKVKKTNTIPTSPPKKNTNKNLSNTTITKLKFGFHLNTLEPGAVISATQEEIRMTLV
jgi:hypothetical protein